MEMTLFDFIIGLVSLFFVLIPLGLFFYILHKERKKVDQQYKDNKEEDL